jgi:hypothetical protein
VLAVCFRREPSFAEAAVWGIGAFVPLLQGVGERAVDMERDLSWRRTSGCPRCFPSPGGEGVEQDMKAQFTENACFSEIYCFRLLQKMKFYIKI